MEPELKQIRGHTFRGCRSPTPVLVDLGANVGRFAAQFVASYPRAQVLLVEADPLLAAELAKQFGDRAGVRLFRGLVGARSNQSEPFFLSKIPEGNSLPRRFAETWSPGESRAIQAEMVTLAGLLELAGIDHVDLLKVDIEGAEWDVLDGFSRDLYQAVDQLTVEFHDFLDPSLRPRTEACIARLSELGYRARCRGTQHVHGSPYFDCLFHKP